MYRTRDLEVSLQRIILKQFHDRFRKWLKEIPESHLGNRKLQKPLQQQNISKIVPGIVVSRLEEVWGGVGLIFRVCLTFLDPSPRKDALKRPTKSMSCPIDIHAGTHRVTVELLYNP
jgi:hypothetical protein